MSKQVICDYCEKVLDEDEEHLWIRVGWRVMGDMLDDACSPECARKLITGLAADQRRIEHETARELASSSPTDTP